MIDCGCWYDRVDDEHPISFLILYLSIYTVNRPRPLTLYCVVCMYRLCIPTLACRGYTIPKLDSEIDIFAPCHVPVNAVVITPVHLRDSHEHSKYCFHTYRHCHYQCSLFAGPKCLPHFNAPNSVLRQCKMVGNDWDHRETTDNMRKR